MKNYSRQREEIIKIIRKMQNHPTAEEIYFAVKQKDTSISRSTVYRNLNGLVLSGELVKIPMFSDNYRYEFADCKPPHGHAICLNCEKIEEFSFDNKNSKIIKGVFQNVGFDEARNSSIIVTGICESCKNSLK